MFLMIFRKNSRRLLKISEQFAKKVLLCCQTIKRANIFKIKYEVIDIFIFYSVEIPLFLSERNPYENVNFPAIL